MRKPDITDGESFVEWIRERCHRAPDSDHFLIVVRAFLRGHLVVMRDRDVDSKTGRPRMEVR